MQIKYTLIDKNNAEFFSQIETRAIEANLSYSKYFDEVKLPPGDYTLRVDVLYGNLQRAFAEQKFSVLFKDVKEEGRGITGLALLADVVLRRLTFSVVLLIVSILLLVGTYWYFARGPFKNTIGLLSYVNGKEVYTDHGLKIGRVYDLMIEDNKIYGLMVVVDSNAPISTPKVMIRYEYVENIKDVVIVNSRIVEDNKVGVSA